MGKVRVRVRVRVRFRVSVRVGRECRQQEQEDMKKKNEKKACHMDKCCVNPPRGKRFLGVFLFLRIRLPSVRETLHTHTHTHTQSSAAHQAGREREATKQMGARYKYLEEVEVPYRWQWSKVHRTIGLKCSASKLRRGRKHAGKTAWKYQQGKTEEMRMAAPKTKGTEHSRKLFFFFFFFFFFCTHKKKKKKKKKVKKKSAGFCEENTAK